MALMERPRIGLLGLMTDGYEPIFPGITARQERYAKEIVEACKDSVELVFPGAAKNRREIEATVESFNAQKLDGMLIVLLAYSQGAWLLRALQDNRLPIALAIVQPDQEIGSGWHELDLTVNQGIHGAQDNANMIMKMGFPCQLFAGNRREERFRAFVEDFGRAAFTYARMRSLRVAIFGRMGGMGDILTDDMAFFAKVGPEFVHQDLGSVAQAMGAVGAAEIDASIAKDHATFDVDTKLPRSSHEEATRIYLGFKKHLSANGFKAFTAHFDNFGADGRFKQLPLMGASHLMAEGYGYAAEGDAVCASMVYAAHQIGAGGGNFTEMYTMDFTLGAIIFCHAGEGNWATCRKDQKPRLIDRFLGEGGLANPPTPLFTPQYGEATLVSLVSVSGGRFRLVLARGEILPKTDMRNCEMPYIFWKPRSGIERCIEAWVAQGGTHHEVINLGDVSARWKMLCAMWGIEYVEV
jgi:L-arabinose isomerase